MEAPTRIAEGFSDPAAVKFTLNGSSSTLFPYAGASSLRALLCPASSQVGGGAGGERRGNMVVVAAGFGMNGGTVVVVAGLGVSTCVGLGNGEGGGAI